MTVVDDARAAFVHRYGALYEHSPWVPERAYDGGAQEGDDLAALFRRVVERAGADAQLALLRAHPDLAGRLGTADLTHHSRDEQAGAGLDQCSPDEFAAFQDLNARYVARFGFPFIIAVKGLDRQAILSAFRARVDGAPKTEFRTALDEVHKIAGFRLAALGAPKTASERVSMAPDQARALVVRALKAHGADADNAAAIADTVCAAEADGSESHGLFRVPGYVNALKSGMVNGSAAPRVLESPPAVVKVDGDKGFTQRAYKVALPLLAQAAKSEGIACLAIRHSFHFAALWHEVEWLAKEGLAGLALTGNIAYLAPHGGKRPIFGTNPLSFAWPTNGHPVVFDLASATMARGDIMIAAREGKAVPPGTGIDADGNPTTNPAAILEGAQLPFGGHKGSAIALMVELLAGGLTADLFSDEAEPASDGSGVPPGGVVVIAVSPERIAGPAGKERAEAFLSRLAGEPGVRMPGARRHANRQKGGDFQVPVSLLTTIKGLADGA
ncbi:MAG: 2-oxo-4-hydroxy-4-carboxy-5-ureidoimidazoline decarboxylase [Pseudomonadota bacterium]